MLKLALLVLCLSFAVACGDEEKTGHMYSVTCVRTCGGQTVQPIGDVDCDQAGIGSGPLANAAGDLCVADLAKTCPTPTCQCTAMESDEECSY